MNDSKKKIIFLIFLFQICIGSFAQKLNFYDHIQPIINKNCTPCHQPNQSAPFSLINYEDVSKRGNFISKIIQERYMPPFPADKKFQNYLNERGLTDEEITKFKIWVENGMEKGNKNKNIELESSKLYNQRKPDLSLKMLRPYQIQGNSQEDFRFFSIPTNHKKNEYIEAIEFKAENKELVHHSRLMVDTTNKIRNIDGLSENDPKVSDFQKISLKDEFLYGWVPGNDKINFPKGTGRKLNANSDFILNMHYAPTPIESKDQSEVHLFFSKEKIEREVNVMVLRENDISNQPFLIKKNKKQTFYVSKKIEKDISLISVLAHMHLIGKSFLSFAITPTGEVINLVKIDNWDINWQMTYQFKKLIKIPKDSIIMIQATYDNTTENPENPNNPPIDISYGWGTKEEMMNFVIYYLNYKIGDENIEQKNQ